MEKFKLAFLDMMNHNKMKLYMFILYTITFIVYFFATYLPFIIDQSIIGGRAALSEMQFGGLIITGYFLLFLTTLFFYVTNDKKTKLFFIITAVFMSLFFLLGVYAKSTIQGSKSGFGLFMTLFVIIMIWIEIFATSKIESLIEKNVPKLLEKIESLQNEESQDTISEINIENGEEKSNLDEHRAQ